MRRPAARGCSRRWCRGSNRRIRTAASRGGSPTRSQFASSAYSFPPPMSRVQTSRAAHCARPPSKITWKTSSTPPLHAAARDSLEHSARLLTVIAASSCSDCPTSTTNGAAGRNLASRSSRTASAVEASVGWVLVTTILKCSVAGYSATTWTTSPSMVFSQTNSCAPAAPESAIAAAAAAIVSFFISPLARRPFGSCGRDGSHTVCERVVARLHFRCPDANARQHERPCSRASMTHRVPSRDKFRTKQGNFVRDELAEHQLCPLRADRAGALLSAELGRSPGVVRGKAFLRVLSLEQPLLQLTLQGETLLEADFQSGGDGALDEPYGARGFRRRHELARVLERPGAELPRRSVDDRIDQPERLSLVDRERRRFGHQLDGLRPPERARQPLGAAGAWQDSERDLRQTDLSRVHARDAQIAGERDLQAAAHAVPVDRRDHELRRLLEPAERLVRVQAEIVLEVGSTLLKHLDVGTGAEELVGLLGVGRRRRAGDHQDMDRLVHPRVEDMGVKLPHHLVAVRVRGRVPQFEDHHA